jgi:peptidoglycan/xylan/chitin deacetylase (PgdA/CDA1 family)
MSKTERLAHFGEATGLAGLVRRLGVWNGILAFTYHRVGDVGWPYDPGIHDASPALLEQQVRILKREFDVIGPEDLETALRAGHGRYVLLTFDDGYRDTFDEALPILKRYGVPATFFITTGFLDDRRIAWSDEIAWMVHTSPRAELRARGWFTKPLSLTAHDRPGTTRILLAVYKSLEPESARAFLDALAEATESGRYPGDGHDLWMTWDDVRQLRASGMQVGGHTVTHPLLARLPPDEQEREIAGCRERIEAELGEPMRWFSYPYGGRDCFDEHTRRSLAEHGVEYAFSFYGGYRKLDDWDPYDVRRRNLGLTVSPERFALMLTFPQVFAWR